MPTTTLFIGSSSASKSQAKALIAAFESATLRFIPWWEAFVAGDTLLANLDRIREQVDGALMVFSPESKATIRKHRVVIPNLNVFFEFGYFYGHFGKNKTAIVKYGEFHLPSDFGGYVSITGSTHFTPNRVVRVGVRTQNEFKRWAAQV